MRRLVAFFSIVLLAVGCAGPLEELSKKAAAEPTVENYMALGAQQMKAKRYQEAVESYRQAVKLEPSSPEAHRNLGVAYVKVGRDKEALEELRLSYRLKPDYQKLLLPLSPPGSNQETRSLEALRQAASAEPGDLQTAFALAQGYHRAGMLDEAADHYQDVLERSPRHSGALYGLGSVYAQKGRYDEAVRALGETVSLKPTWSTPHYTLGLVYLVRGDVESAFREYQVLRQLDPPLADSLFAKIYE